jgi:hypothetical protein
MGGHNCYMGYCCLVCNVLAHSTETKEDIEIFGNDDFKVKNGGLLPDDLSELNNFYKWRLMPSECFGAWHQSTAGELTHS